MDNKSDNSRQHSLIDVTDILMKNKSDRSHHSLIGVVKNLTEAVKLLTADNDRLEGENRKLSSYIKLLEEIIDDNKSRQESAAPQENGISNENTVQAAD